MAERIPDNLAFLYGQFGREAIDAILPGDTFVVDGVEFVCKYAPESTAERFYIVKPLSLVERYRGLAEAAKGGNIFELGIAEGGSTALLALWAEPAKLVAIDLEQARLGALDEFIEARNLQSSVSALWGVDQSDGPRLAEIVRDEFGGEPIDLVIDDASHYFSLTRVSFNALFPYLRPGGVYIIEDWEADIVMRDALTRVLEDSNHPNRDKLTKNVRAALARNAKAEPAVREEPMTRLALELVLACAASGDAVAEVSMNRSYVAVTRGAADLDPAGFDLDQLYRDHFSLIAPPPD